MPAFPLHSFLSQHYLKRGAAGLFGFAAFALASPAAETPCGFISFSQGFDGVIAPALPAGWTASQGMNLADPLWMTSVIMPYTAPNAVFSTVPDHVLDNRLETPAIQLYAGPNTLFLRHQFDFQNGFDGGILEVSAPNINGGQFTEFTAAGGYFHAGGYNTRIVSPSNPLAGQMAWTGNSGGYITTKADFGNITGATPQTLKLRLRMVSDEGVSSGDWRADHIAIQYNECNPPVPSPTPPCFPHWSTGPALPTAAFHSAGVYFPANGRFYVMGGRSSNMAGSDLMHPLEFDPVNNTWAIKAATFPDNMVNDMVCEVLADVSATPFIYCVGGSAAGGSTATDRLFRYDPVSDSVTHLDAPWPGNTSGDTLPGGGARAQNKLYLLGGYRISIGMTDRIWEFRPDTNVWVQRTAILPVPLGYLSVTANGNSISSVGGTVLEPPGTLYDIANAFSYEPALDQVSAVYPLPRQTSGARAVVTNGELKVLAGGNAPHTSPHVDVLSNFWHVWLRGEDLAVARRNFAAASDGSRIWLGGGLASDNTPLDSMEIYQCPASSPTPTATPMLTPTATPTATPTSTAIPSPTPSPAQALNISTRLRVETRDRILIGGFIITGTAPKKVAIRGIGPSLTNSGLSGVLADPTLTLFDTDSSLLENDNWQDDAAQAQLIALGLAPQHPSESGMVMTLAPGQYTALVAGKKQTTGIGLVEIYDVDPAAASQLANISTRGFVRTGDNVMIGGFILGNASGTTNVVVRALGPSLSHFMLPDFLADPTLELRDANGLLLIANDDWQDDPASAAQLVAHNLQPSVPAESAIFASLPAGAFTAIVAGTNGDVGTGLVEVYKIPE